MARRTYTPEQKAQALARVLAGEPLTKVAAEVGIEHHALSMLLKRKKDEVTAVVTLPTLREDLSLFLHESLLTLTKHARLYRSDEWLKGDPDKVLESTRTLGSRFTAIMDRIGGRVTNDDSDAS